MQDQSTPTAQRHARTLRREMTESERKLWSALRGEQMGAKFRRQHPLGRYIADFACLDPRIIVELDGSQHQLQVDYDRRRDEFFRAQGFEVLRFQTDAPFTNLAGLLQVISDQLKRSGPAPTPTLPQGGRENEKESQS